MAGSQFNKQLSYVNETYLSWIGEDLTSKFIGHKSFGEDKEIQKETVVRVNYIDESRVESLRSIKSNFDLSKLVRLCEELNSNYHLGNYYSIAMLGRSIIDHVPPIFGCTTFNEVSNNYGSKSLKGSLKHLNESMRNISDGFLHSHIRKNESLPTNKQVNFSQDLDVLLGEIISVLSVS